jgi:hypothetical protein
MKMKQTIKILVIAGSLIIAGCSSSRDTGREDEREEEKVVIREVKEAPAKVFLPMEFREREYVRESRIESIDKISFDYDVHRNLTNREKLSTIKFNRKGFPTETITYDRGEEISNRFSYLYDNKGFRTETRRIGKEGKADKIYTYEYDEMGNKVRSERFDMKGNLEKYYIYKNDENGNLIEDIWYDADGTLEFRIVNRYDEAGNKIESTSYNDGERMVARYEFKYDGKGNIIEEVKYDEYGQPLGIIQYVYRYF